METLLLMSSILLCHCWWLGAFPTRAQSEVLRQNQSFSRTTEIPNSSKFPKMTSISSFAFPAFEYPEMKARNFEVSILMKSRFLQTGIFTNIPPYTCDSQPLSSASNALHASFNDECSRTQASIIIFIHL